MTDTAIPITWHSWAAAAFRDGTSSGVRLADDALVIDGPVGTLDYADPFGDGGTTAYEWGRWLSPSVATPFGLTELVASWNATTPAGTWVEIEVRGVADTGQQTGWYVLGRWSSYDEGFHRTTVTGQADEVAKVDADVLATREGRTLSSWQLRATLYRASGTAATPRLTLVGAMASAVPAQTPTDSPLGGAEGRVIDVPAYSQMIHRGEYPEWDNGGEAWCSATSTAMVLDYWGVGPTPAETSWVRQEYADPQVDHAARSVYDYAYQGAGNWPFNTAYAATRGLQAFVTRLRSLTEAEQFIAAGIPLVVSTSFTKAELDGAGYDTKGHLMVLVGFDEAGNPVLNDPASHSRPSNEDVRVTYDRAQFERVWARSGRVVYVIRPADVALPTPPAQANW